MVWIGLHGEVPQSAVHRRLEAGDDSVEPRKRNGPRYFAYLLAARKPKLASQRRSLMALSIGLGALEQLLGFVDILSQPDKSAHETQKAQIALGQLVKS